MRNVLIITALGLLHPGTVSAQTTQCQWVGNVWTCNQQRSGSSIQWQNGIAPDVGGNAMEAYNRGRREREEADRATLEADRITAERDFYRSRTLPSEPLLPPNSAPASSYGQAWVTAANQRSHLFKDFAKVVFAPDVRITDEMVMLMSGSPYAADIAYYLGTHKAEAMAISRLPLLDAARAIDAIESRIKTDVESGNDGTK